MKYGDALAEVQTQIEAAGIPCYIDAEKAMAPCALLVPGVLRFDRLSGSEDYSAEVDVYLLAPGNNSLDALNHLQDLLEQLSTAFPIPEAEPISFPLGSAGSIPLPGLAITLNLNVSKD
ncbi:hypothetical protein ACIOTN_17295 [Glutamicibacter sp. NPDC087661]|uniref:hypothetical protein n=1 Tax=Glutamicibacter sp. NPDC087661 TaxID=3363996 RepID=UPI003827FF98